MPPGQGILDRGGGRPCAIAMDSLANPIVSSRRAWCKYSRALWKEPIGASRDDRTPAIPSDRWASRQHLPRRRRPLPIAKAHRRSRNRKQSPSTPADLARAGRMHQRVAGCRRQHRSLRAALGAPPVRDARIRRRNRRGMPIGPGRDRVSAGSEALRAVPPRFQTERYRRSTSVVGGRSCIFVPTSSAPPCECFARNATIRCRHDFARGCTKNPMTSQ